MRMSREKRRGKENNKKKIKNSYTSKHDEIQRKYFPI
jgi:hypothetical protein